MKKYIYIYVLFSISFINLSAQDIILTFNVINSTSKIDSIKAIKTLSGETAFVEGSNTLNLGSFTTGIELTQTNSDECKVFPNPFNNQAELELYSDNSDNIIVYLINTSGQLVAKRNQMIVKGINKFTITANETGIYTLSIIGKHCKYSKEIISLNAI